MASGGEVGGALTDNIGSEDLEDVKCQPCQEDGEIREAVGVCTDCQEYLCQRCFDGHKIPKLTRGHQLLNKQEMVQSQVQLTKKDKCTVRCLKHSDKNVKYYCATHGKLSCSVCLNLDHRVCQGVIYIPDIADDLENNGEYKQADDHLSSVLARFKKATETAEQNSKSLDSSYNEALKTIRIFRKEINDAIDRIEREILKRASEIKSAEMERMARGDEERAQAENELKATLAKLEIFRKQKQNCNLFTEMMDIKTKLDTLGDELKTIERGQSYANTDIKFTPNMETLDCLRQTEALGKLAITTKHRQPKDVGSPVSDVSTIVKADHSHDINVKCADDKNDCWITGSVILPDNRLLIADCYNSKLKAVDVKHGQVSSQLTLSSNPWDISVINSNQVAVTVPYDNKVEFVTTSGKLVVDRSLQLGQRCHGIDYKDEKLAVSFADSNQIKILDLQGTVLHSIKPVKRDLPLFERLFYTSFGPDSTTIYVSNDGTHGVLYTKLDGTVLSSYTDNLMKEPRKIVLGRCGNVYVCNRSTHSIHQLTPDCKKIRVLLTEKDGLNHPYTISYSDSENKLYVGMQDCNSVKVYNVILGRH